MPLHIRCEKCNKSLIIPRREAGLSVLCPACGYRFNAPTVPLSSIEIPDFSELKRSLATAQTPGASPELPAAVSPAGEESAAPPPEAIRATPPSSAVAMRPPPPPPAAVGTPSEPADEDSLSDPHNFHAPLAWVIVSLLVLVAGVLVVALMSPRHAVSAQRQQVLELKARADDLLLAGNLRDAFTGYQKALDVVGDKEINDPVLREAIAQVQVSQKQVFAKLSNPNLSLQPATTGSGGQYPLALPVNSAASEPSPVQTRAPAPAPPALAHRDIPAPSPAVASPPAVPAGPPPFHPLLNIHKPVEPTEGAITDDQIGEAIKKGVDYLIANEFDKNGTRIENRENRGFGSPQNVGETALCVYALLQAGQAIKDDRLNPHGDFVKGMIDNLKAMKVEGRYETYTHSLRIAALTVLNRDEDRACIKLDLDYLFKAVVDGGYTYGMTPNPMQGNIGGMQIDQSRFDNSNSQYGLLGVWLAAEANDLEVPATYWEQVQKHWDQTQFDNGAWGYTGRQMGGERLSMTAAGIASLFVCHDWLDPAQFGAKVGRDPFSPQLVKALAWLEKGDNSMRLSDFGNGGYCLYGIERVGLASGFKYFGTHDWYREQARLTVDDQDAGGSWSAIPRAIRNNPRTSANLADTAYHLLFLARGRHPILMNKLRFDGAWANRPRDVANLARFATHELERPFNWQVNSIDRDWTDWMDSPILYLASHEPPKLTDQQVDNIRQYILNGGMLFTQADGNSQSFDAFARDLAKKLFPEYEMKDVPQDSILFKQPYAIAPPRPPLKMITNGSRILMLHSPTDITQAWQQRADITKRNVFQLGLNIYLLAAGRSEANNRLTTTVIPEPGGAKQTIDVARVKYAGDWNPEPGAWPRFARWFGWQTGIGIKFTPVDVAALDPRVYPIAHLTGSFEYAPTGDQLKALSAYVHAGGVLIIDACGGSDDFVASVQQEWLPKLFPDGKKQILSLEHPILLGNFPGGEVINHFTVRPSVIEHYNESAPKPILYQYGDGYCLFSPLDITTGLLGTKTWNIIGYDPAMAQRFLKNAMLWTYNNAGPKKDDKAP